MGHGVCWTCWSPPHGPHTPFAQGLAWVDTLRVVALALGLIGIVLLVADALLSSEPGQRLRLGAQAVALFILGTIELEHLGDTANWRLLLVVAVNLWTCAGGVFFLVYEPHRRRVWRRTHPSSTHPSGTDPGSTHTSGAHTSGAHTSSTHTSSTHTSV